MKNTKNTSAPMSAEALRGIQAIVDSLREITVSLDLEETLEATLDGAESLFPYNAAAVYVVHPETRQLIASAERGYPAAGSVEPGSRKSRDVLDKAFRHGRRLTADVSAEPAYIERRRSTKTEVAVPILGSGRRMVGALILESDVGGAYPKGSSHLLELYASAIAGAVERAVLHGKILRARRLEQELEFARRVMRGLLPRSTPRIAGAKTAAMLKPQLDVGGDYYDFIPVDKERWGIVVADVVGKGIGAALLMSTLRASLHSLARSELALRSTFRRANRFFRESAEEGKYATVFYGELDVANGRLMYINAGHMPPVVVRGGGRIELLEAGGPPLGLFGESKYVEGVLELGAGDVLGLYTDGITDATNPNDEPYGIDGLARVLKKHRKRAVRDICEDVFRDVERFQESSEVNDDRTLVVMQFV